MDVLLTWVGSRDPAWNNSRTGQRELGPILSLLKSRPFDVVYLLFNLDVEPEDFAKRALDILQYCNRYWPAMKVVHKPIDLRVVTDYREIYHVVNDTCQRIMREEGQDDRNYYVYLSPGTPQMQTIWVLLVQAGLLPARMLSATSRDQVAPEFPIWQEVILTLENFPQVVSPGEVSRQVGILQAQKDTLTTENRRLRADLDVLRTGEPPTLVETIPEGFKLPDYLTAREKELYVRALEQANDNASQAARLLGLEPHTFRERAENLGVRERRRKKGQT